MKISTSFDHITEIPCDLLIVPFFEGEEKMVATTLAIDRALAGFLKAIIEEEGFTGKPGKTLLVHTHRKISAARILVVGVGKKSEWRTECFRRLAGIAVTAARGVRAKRLTFSFEGLLSERVPIAETTQAFVEGALLGAYQFVKYKKEAREKAKASAIDELILVERRKNAKRQMEKAIERGKFFADATIMARDLVNEPAGTMKPKHLAAVSEKLCKIPGVRVRVYSEAEIRKLGMGALLAVAAGSDDPPSFIHLSYTPKQKRAKKVAICGKGVTFDSGGLSLKPWHQLNAMKMDMAGAAAIIGLFSQMAKLQPHAIVHGVIAAAENMPSGKATRPGDVVTAYNGKTIEITNTDAEGRLLLADALSWAEAELQPDVLIDIATLTGAALNALGQEVAGTMSTNQKLLRQIESAAMAAGEPMWELPFVPEYAQFGESKIADVNNLPTVNWGGAIMGGMFLQEFVKNTPWAHIDIAGPAWAEKQVLPYVPYGGTGFGVRSLMHFLASFA